MGRQIIKQPDGKYSVFSSISDTICMVDATADDVVAEFVESARERAEREARQLLAVIDSGQHPYQFSMTWEEAYRLHGSGNCDKETDRAVRKAAKRFGVTKKGKKR